MELKRNGRILKLQSGGSFYSIYESIGRPNYGQAQQQSAGYVQKKAETKEKKESGQLTEKDFFDLVKGIDALPNELNSIVTNLENMFTTSKLLGSSSDLSSMYFDAIRQIKLAEQNKKRYDKVRENVAKNGAENEYAISEDGRIIAMDNNYHLKRVTLYDLAQNHDKYRPISVSQLLLMRSQDNNFIMDQQVFGIANNSVGFEEFQKLIGGISDNLGKDSIETRSNNESSIAADGLNAIMNLDEDQKAEILQEIGSGRKLSANSSNNYRQIDALVNYVSKMLPTRMKTWAALKLEMVDPEQAARNLVASYYLKNAKSDVRILNDKEGSSKSSSSKSSGNNKGDTRTNMTFSYAVQTGIGGHTQSGQYGHDNFKFTVNGVYYGDILSNDGDSVTGNTLEYLLQKSNLLQITNGNSVSFGKYRVPSIKKDSIAITTSGAFRAVLPAKKTSDGKVVPDYDKIEHFGDIVNDILTDSSIDPGNKQYELLKRLSEDSVFKDFVNGKDLDPRYFHTFLLLNGISTSSDLNINLGNNPDKDYDIQVIDDDEASKSFLKRIMARRYGHINKEDEDNVKKYKLNGKVITGTVYVPINTDNLLSGLLGSNIKLTDAENYQIESNPNKMNETGSDNL